MKIYTYVVQIDENENGKYRDFLSYTDDIDKPGAAKEIALKTAKEMTQGGSDRTRVVRRG